jgi:ribonuclease E
MERGERTEPAERVRAEQAEHAARALREEHDAEPQAEPSTPLESAMPEVQQPAAAAVEPAAYSEPAAAAAPIELSATPEPAAPAPAVSHVEPAAPAVVVAPATAPVAPIDVDKALQESGLVLVQTDPSKVKLAEPPAEPQFVPARPRPRRAPPPDTGPLEIVETRKDA